jgi:hypothetical protein
MRVPKLSFIWFVGAAVWWFDAAVALHYDHKPHALLALGIACLFFLAGMTGVKTNEKRR